MSTMHRAIITRITSEGVYVEIPALGNGVEYGPLVPPVDAANFQFFTVQDTVTVDLSLVGTGFPKVLSADVKPNSIPLTDLSDVVITAPASGELVRYSGTGWVNARAALDDLSDVVVSAPAIKQTLRHDGSTFVNAALAADDLSDVAVSAPAAGQTFRHDGSNFVNVDPNLVGFTGEIRMYGGFTAPNGWWFCDGTALDRTTDAALYAVIAPSLGTATITIASPGVVTLNSHGLVAGDAVFFTTTGALPTGLSANTVYYVQAAGLTTNTFRLSATVGGADINTSGTQSGVHTLRRGPYGISSATTFNVPNMKGKGVVGPDSAQTEFANIGETGGEKTHTLTSTEMPVHTHVQNAHNHAITDPQHSHADITSAAVGGTGVRDDYNSDSASSAFSTNLSTGGSATGITINNTTATNQNAGSGGAHNNLQPYIVVPYIIKR